MIKTEAKDLKKVYRYWISKADDRIHKDLAYIQELKMDEGENHIIIYDSAYHNLGDMKKSEFENMLKRSVGQFIILYAEKDDLAYEHFMWAAKKKIKESKEQVGKYESLLKTITEKEIKSDI